MLYYLESLERSPIGNCRVFWRPASRGYTIDVGEAGLYEEAEARAIVQGARGQEIAWPQEGIEANSRAHVEYIAPDDEPEAMKYEPEKA